MEISTKWYAEVLEKGAREDVLRRIASIIRHGLS
jgi:hypothetical protein